MGPTVEDLLPAAARPLPTEGHHDDARRPGSQHARTPGVGRTASDPAPQTRSSRRTAVAVPTTFLCGLQGPCIDEMCGLLQRAFPEGLEFPGATAEAGDPCGRGRAPARCGPDRAAPSSCSLLLCASSRLSQAERGLTARVRSLPAGTAPVALRRDHGCVGGAGRCRCSPRRPRTVQEPPPPSRGSARSGLFPGCRLAWSASRHRDGQSVVPVPAWWGVLESWTLAWTLCHARVVASLMPPTVAP